MTAQLPEAAASPSSDPWTDSAWQSELVRPLLIAILATSLVTGFLALIAAIWPATSVGRILPLAFLAALVGVYSTHWLNRPGQRLVHRVLFRLGELVLLLALLRVFTWALTGDWPAQADVRRWILQPGDFFDTLYVLASLLALLAWSRSCDVAGIFDRLALTPAELAWRAEQDRGAWRQRMPVEQVPIPRQEQVESYLRQWLIGGGLLVFCAGVTNVRVDTQGGVRVVDLGLPPQLVVAIIAYFLIGLTLLSQARLASLRARWLQEGVESLGALPGRWQRLSLLLVLGIGLLAILLPLGSTWQAGHILEIVVSVVVQIVYTLAYLILAALVKLITALGLGGDVPPELPQPPPVDQDLLGRPPVLEPTHLPPWLAGLSFWLVAIAVVVAAASYVLGRQGIALNLATLGRAGRALLARLRGWWRGVQDLAGRVAVGRPGGRAEEASGAPRARFRFIRLNSLSPREQVRYFYVSTVRRAGQQGVARAPSQTPLEYVRRLDGAWPDAEPEVHALTEAFIVARYDKFDITEPEAQHARTVWQRVKRALRKGGRT